MPLIDPRGLLYGERLGDCSDEAQLHWPRLFSAANGYGRTELSYERLCDTVYQSFKKRPTCAQLSAIFQDYQKNFLLFVYEAADGSIWGQWITSEKFLPTYKTQADRNSPAPDPEAVKQYLNQYISNRKAKYLSFQSFHKSSKTSEKVSSSPEDLPLGVGVGVGVGEVESGGNSCSSDLAEGSESNAASAEPKQVRSAPSVAGTIPLNTGKQFPIFEAQVQNWTATYPAVDVRQELREIRAWCDSNPSRRKTQRGVLKFVNSWLAREQDKGGKGGGNGNGIAKTNRAQTIERTDQRLREMLAKRGIRGTGEDDVGDGSGVPERHERVGRSPDAGNGDARRDVRHEAPAASVDGDVHRAGPDILPPTRGSAGQAGGAYGK